MTSAIAIDLGSARVGWAVYELRPCENPTAWPVSAGTWKIENLKATKGSKRAPGRAADHRGTRWNRLAARLDETWRGLGELTVFFEEVQRHEGRWAAAAHYGALGILEYKCAGCGMSPTPVQVADVKRFALGRGAGKKEEVIAAIARAFPHLGDLDQHASDAVAIGGAGLTAAGWRIERAVVD